MSPRPINLIVLSYYITYIATLTFDNQKICGIFSHRRNAHTSRKLNNSLGCIHIPLFGQQSDISIEVNLTLNMYHWRMSMNEKNTHLIGDHRVHDVQHHGRYSHRRYLTNNGHICMN